MVYLGHHLSYITWLMSRRLVSKPVRNEGSWLLLCLTSVQPSAPGFTTCGRVWGFLLFFKALPLLSDTVTALVGLNTVFIKIPQPNGEM